MAHATEAKSTEAKSTEAKSTEAKSTEAKSTEANAADGGPAATRAETPPPRDVFGLGGEVLRFDLGGSGSLYTSAAEVSTSGESNQRLANDAQFGMYTSGTWRFWGPFSVGWFGQFDLGRRDYGRFDRVADDGETALVVRDGGGPFWEVWTGPLLRVQWRALYVEGGWGAFGVRGDDARTDLPNTDGDTDGAFRTTPTIAWQLGIGANVEVAPPVFLALRLNYRIRYYETRGGADLAQGLAHGTQDILPFIGFAYRLDESLF
ncbi:MAG: hypothetical protein AAGN82_25900 [Myxococcota bacterium]